MSETDGARDFDFLKGRWRIKNRRLRERLRGSNEWDEFDATFVFRTLLNGFANEDEMHTDYGGGFIGMSFRFFNRATKQWSIYWATDRTGVLEPPVTGSFSEGRGFFEGDDVCNGQPVRVRFIWSRITTGRPRWEQAFSNDGGATWETNWIMDFEPVSESA